MRAVAVPVLLLGLALSGQADEQPNPYKFPAASGDRIPIVEGYWATSQEACAKLQLTDEARPHVGLKSFPIASSDTFPTYTFQYFAPRLGNWPDGLCFVRTIKRDAGSKYRLTGFCGDAPTRENAFAGEVVVHGERRISISGKDVVPAGDYFFCRAAKTR